MRSANFINLTKSLFSIEDDFRFSQLALEIFHHQYKHTSIYHNYVDHLKIAPDSVKSPEKIPFLPIRFFKSHEVIADYASPKVVFGSSGTTGINQSRHQVHDPLLYQKSFRKAFSHFYGDPDQYCFLALLPSYLERGDSSLVYMMENLISSTKHLGSGFYLDNLEELHVKLRHNEHQHKPTVLIGVTYALLDFALKYPGNLKSAIVMETGGMKGRREEMTRQEVHQELRRAFGAVSVHSEYGMTELLTQAYSTGNGIFRTPAWMKIYCRDTSDPLEVKRLGRGGLNVIDLANVHSCSFIATDDLCVIHPDQSFEVTGRYDQAEARGCNLMIA